MYKNSNIQQQKNNRDGDAMNNGRGKILFCIFAL